MPGSFIYYTFKIYMHGRSEMIKFKILIPVYNDWDSLERLLNKLLDESKAYKR